jgi:hypothetical protein
VVLSSEESELDPAAEVWPPEAFFGGCDEVDADGEGELLVSTPVTPLAFSLAKGSVSAAPGLKLLSSSTLRGRISPYPRYVLGSSLAQSRPAVSMRLARTWFAVQSGWADQIRAAEAEAMAVAWLVPLLVQYERNVSSHHAGTPSPGEARST